MFGRGHQQDPLGGYGEDCPGWEEEVVWEEQHPRVPWEQVPVRLERWEEAVDILFGYPRTYRGLNISQEMVSLALV